MKHPQHGTRATKPESDEVSQSIMHNLKGVTGDGEMQNLKDAIPHDDVTRTQLLEQQAESVRYLNELNTVRRNPT